MFRALLGLDAYALRLGTFRYVYVRPLTVRQTLVIDGLFSPYAADFAEAGIDSIALQHKHATELIKIVSVVIDKPVAFVEKLDVADWHRIWKRLMEVAGDFLRALVSRAAATQKARPQLKPIGKPRGSVSSRR